MNESDDPTAAALPLTEVTYCILLSLAPSPKHGYAIMQDVALLSQHRVTLSTGTLYGALKRLLDLEWITRSDLPAPPTSGRALKPYRLTTQGRAILNAEVARLERLVAAAHVRAVRGQP